MIGKIGPANNIQPSNKPNHVSKTTAPKADRVDISSDAQKRAEHTRQMEIIRSAPDIRQDKVEQAKANLERYMQDGEITDETANGLYDRIIGSLLG